MNRTGIGQLGLRGFQGMNATYYLIQNDRNYDTPRMVSRIHQYVGRIQKAARKNKKDPLSYCLCMSFSWSLALGNRLHVDLEGEMLKSYPEVCPYCTKPVCFCKEQGEDRAVERKKNLPPMVSPPTTLTELQLMLSQIYPKNTLKESVAHLCEEVTEVDEAGDYFYGVHDPRLFENIVMELVDTIANILAVATCANINLAVEMEKVFGNGCPICHLIPCKCGFTISKFAPIR